MEININEIASAKIKAMEENGVIRKLIEDGVEDTVKKAVKTACEDYEFRNEVSKGVSSLLGQVAGGINFSAYANFLRDRLNGQIEQHVKNDMARSMCDSFEKMYFNIPEDVKLSDILNKYKEYIINHLDDDDKKEWGHIDFSFNQEYSSFIKIKAGSHDKSKYGRFDKGVEMCLCRQGKDKKAKIVWIRHDGNDFRNCMDLGMLSEFEILMFNLMFTQKEIEVDIDEDFHFDYDLEDEDYD